MFIKKWNFTLLKTIKSYNLRMKIKQLVIFTNNNYDNNITNNNNNNDDDDNSNNNYLYRDCQVLF